MIIHCAFCGKPFEKDLTPPYGEVECPACNRTFDLSSRVTVPLPEPDAAPQGTFEGARFGGYRVVREIGRGGMGVVFEGVQESLDRKVAIKVLFKESCSDPHFVARFEREAESLARLNHPNIVTILDRGCQDSRYYFVMEHVDGVSLRSMMESGRLSPEQALAIIPPLCDALEYAHGEGVIHRDIKPENILVDRLGRVKIADFGLSRIIGGDQGDGRITRSRMIMGTPDYMAPEQRENSKQADHRADIFALGVVFYEMLTGELPLGKFPPPSRKGLRIDVRLDEIVLKVLEKDPDRRYQRASDIASDLARISSPGRPGPSGPMPQWSPVGPALAQRAGLMPGGKRTFLEIVEDGWDSWVLALALVLTIFSFFPFVTLLVAWIALRKTVLAHKAARLAGARAIRVNDVLPQPGPKPAPQPAAQQVPIVRSDRPGPSAPERAPAAPPPAPVQRNAGPENAQRPRLSFLALLSSAYSITLLGTFLGLYLPFESAVNKALLDTPIDLMPAALAAGACVGIPGALGLILAAAARGRISVHPHLGGSFLALIGLAGSIVFLGVAARKWYDGYETYRAWSALRDRAAQGDADAIDELIVHARNPARRKRALETAASMQPDQGRVFFAWAAGESGDLGWSALDTWAGKEALVSDPESRMALLGRISELLGSPAPETRARATGIFERLRGEDSAAILEKAASDPDAGVRRAAARVIRAWKDPSRADTASLLAVDSDETAAMAALEAIEGLEDSSVAGSVLQRLAAVVRDSPHKSLRKRALENMRKMLEKIGQGKERLRELIGEEALKSAETGPLVEEMFRDDPGE